MANIFNPLSNADIYIYPKDRDIRDPRIDILRPFSTGIKNVKGAVAFKGQLEVFITEANQLEVYLNGKRVPDHQFSIKFNGKARRRLFSTT